MSRSNDSGHILVKLHLKGDTSVGKSSVLLRYVDDQFSESFITTIGIDFKIKTIQMGDRKVKLQIWDTAGQERFKAIVAAYYRGAMGIILVYNVANRNTFNNIKDWMRQIEMHADENVNKVLIGNKCDVGPSEREVSTAEGEALAAEYKIKFFETSAKQNLGVTEAFESITMDIVERLTGLADCTGGGYGGQENLLLKKTTHQGGCC